MLLPSSAATSDCCTLGPLWWVVWGFELSVDVLYMGKFGRGKLANRELFTSSIFRHSKNVFGIIWLTVAYSPNYSLPIAFTCMVCQNFPYREVRYNILWLNELRTIYELILLNCHIKIVPVIFVTLLCLPVNQRLCQPIQCKPYICYPKIGICLI